MGREDDEARDEMYAMVFDGNPGGIGGGETETLIASAQQDGTEIHIIESEK